MKDKVVQINSRDFATLGICAIRYSLGRRTYMPGLVCEIIKSHINDIVDTDLDIMLRDINEYSGMFNQMSNDDEMYGDPCDFETWKDMVSFLKSTIKERKSSKDN